MTTVIHGRDEYVRYEGDKGYQTTNTVEGF